MTKYLDECPLCGHGLIEDERGNSYCPASHRVKTVGKEKEERK